jgi:hypothetical protein
MARYDRNNEKEMIANDLIYPNYGFGDAYLTGVFTGSDFEMTCTSSCVFYFLWIWEWVVSALA